MTTLDPVFIPSAPPNTQVGVQGSKYSHMTNQDLDKEMARAFEELVDLAKLSSSPSFVRTTIEPTQKDSSPAITLDPKPLHFRGFEALEKWYKEVTPHLHPLNHAAEDMLAKLRERHELSLTSPEVVPCIEEVD